MSEPTHYEVLKLRPGATPEQIRTAYKKLSRLYHPDMDPNNPQATDVMAKLNASYDVLSNPELRRAYDATLAPPPAPRTSPKAAPRAAADRHAFVMPEADDAPAPRARKAARPRTRHRVNMEAEQAEANRAFLALMVKRMVAFVIAGVFIVYLSLATTGGGHSGTHEWLILRALRQMFTGL